MGNGDIVLVFDIYNDGEYLGKQEFSQEAIAMGSGEAAALRIENDALNVFEVVFNISDGVVKMGDLVGESRPLFRNGEAVVSNTIVQSGDVIEIGPVRLELSITNPNAAETTQPNTPVTSGDDKTDPSVQDSSSETTDVIGTTGPSLNKQAAPAPTPQVDVLAAPKLSEESPLEFVLNYSPKPTQGGSNKVLEVAQIFEKDVIDVKHFSPSANSVSIGSDTGYKFRFAGQSIAWVPSSFAKFGWLMYPFTEAPEEWKTDFFYNLEQFELFQWDNNTPICNIHKDWQGFVEIGDEQFSFADLIAQQKMESTGSGYQYRVDENSRVVIDTGNVQFFAQLVPSSKKIASGIGQEIDYPFLGILFFMAAVLTTLTLVVYFQPPSTTTSEMQIEDRFAEILLQEPPPPEEEKPDANPDAGEGAKAKKEEGRVGKKDAKMKNAKGDKVEQRAKDKAQVEDLVGGLNFGAPSDDGALDGMNNPLSGNSQGIGGVLGAKGVQVGSGGLGSSGSGLGGGGTASGLGGLGNKGSGRGRSGYGTGGGSFGKKKKGAISRRGRAIVLGALDKSLIDRVIKRNMSQIRYCYQRQLSKNPSLSGKITIKFVISKTGGVSRASVKRSTMGNKAVESCIAGRFKRFKFPQPKGGGIVIVSYPFIFSPG